MLRPEDLNRFAAFMLSQHGARALDYAESAILELRRTGETARAEAWNMVQMRLEDMLGGRITRGGHAIH
ncbi:hypothetical protein ACSHT0_08905 [Tepidicaulis sp. LMO-SS28]|uniref:hypothetical protein n=1 Tax=Tepidicaulis sp. LMO-SS28 TaxID=3447455 RepID=UPI003EE00F85